MPHTSRVLAQHSPVFWMHSSVEKQQLMPPVPAQTDVPLGQHKAGVLNPGAAHVLPALQQPRPHATGQQGAPGAEQSAQQMT